MENTKYGRRREGRWTPIGGKAQDTRANPNSWETHLVRKRWDIGLIRALSPRFMMMMKTQFTCTNTQFTCTKTQFTCRLPRHSLPVLRHSLLRMADQYTGNNRLLNHNPETTNSIILRKI